MHINNLIVLANSFRFIYFYLCFIAYSLRYLENKISQMAPLIATVSLSFPTVRFYALLPCWLFAIYFLVSAITKLPHT